ncbi:MAG: tRNA threonylcarbamoyladenosine dehydratase [Saprospiraceae bacterium]
MEEWKQRTELLLGSDAMTKLANAHVLVVGLGGVGSYAAECLVRAGVGKLSIVDGDDVEISNKNRQLQALDSTIGRNKAELLAERFRDINAKIVIKVYPEFLEPEAVRTLLLTKEFDFVMDCIDSIKPKLSFILLARALKLRSISAMGAGGKLDPSKIKIADISKTRECKFSQQLKKMLKRKGVKDGVMTVYSEEIQAKHSLALTDGANYKRSYYGTISYMPAMFGMTMAAYVIRKLINS